MTHIYKHENNTWHSRILDFKAKPLEKLYYLKLITHPMKGWVIPIRPTIDRSSNKLFLILITPLNHLSAKEI